jgi:hypothetical protein
MIMPISTYKALREAGLTKEQATEAWRIIVEHLGIASPTTRVLSQSIDPNATPKAKPKRSSKPKHKEAVTDDEAFWRKYDAFKNRRFPDDSEDSAPECRVYCNEEKKPKHAIEVTTLINAEVKRLLNSEPEPESETDAESKAKIVRKNKSGQW